MKIEFAPTRNNCEGVSRRDFLKVGMLSGLGLTLPSLLAHREAAAAAGRKPANMIFIWLDGGPTHMETFDPKPEAPSENRGEFKAIETNVSGIRVSEHMTKTAKVMDLFTIVRSIHHNDSNHGAGNHLMTTGMPTPVPVGCGTSVSYHPSMASFTALSRQAPHGLPPYITLGRKMRSGGPNFLGAPYSPLVVGDSPNKENFRVKDVSLPEGIDDVRLDARRNLLSQLDTLQRVKEAPGDPVASNDSYSEKAYALVTSPQAKKAFDINEESAKTRDAYSRSTFGQQALLARRLVEAGVPWVSIHWGGWDHHGGIFSALKTKLPPLDQGFSYLLTDLKQRGMLDDTLVVMLGEFGRTPKVNSRGGRDHWGPAMSVAFAGAGVPGGQVLGSTTADGAYADEYQLSPQDYACTILRKLGIDYRQEFKNEVGRPTAVVRDGEPIKELF